MQQSGGLLLAASSMAATPLFCVAKCKQIPLTPPTDILTGVGFFMSIIEKSIRICYNS